MGFLLLPSIVLSFFLGLIAIERNYAQDRLPPTIALQAAQSGQTFVAYRNAVAVYQKNNPTFTGTVSNAALAAQGNQFPSVFLVSASNAITATGVAGRVITCYAALSTGAISAALAATETDASLGMASGLNWISSAFGTSTLLATSVPNGNVVSVIQIGN
jgi:hypothetical protein